MKKPRLVFLLMTWWLPTASSGVSLALLPALSETDVGGTVSIELAIADLGDGLPPSAGSFDVDLTFDDSLLRLDSVDFGASLGAPLSLQEVLPGAGEVSLAEVSLLSPGELDALQSDGFVLANLQFTAVEVGTSEVAFADALVGDGFGQPLPVELLGPANVVSTAATAVPEPGALALFALGSLVVSAAVRRG